MSQSLSSAASAASATATKLASDAEQGLGGLSTVSITIAVLVTLLAVVAAAIYFSGYADDLGRWGAKKYYVGKAEAEAKALGNMGGEKVEGFLKGEGFTTRLHASSRPCPLLTRYAGSFHSFEIGVWCVSEGSHAM